MLEFWRRVGAVLLAAGLLAAAQPARADDEVAASAYDGKGVHETFTLMSEIMARCARETGDTATYDDAEAEYVVRNEPIRDLANRLLDFWGETYDPTELAQSRTRKLDALFVTHGGPVAVCASYVAGIYDGGLDFSEYAPELVARLYASEKAIAEQ